MEAANARDYATARHLCLTSLKTAAQERLARALPKEFSHLSRVFLDLAFQKEFVDNAKRYAREAYGTCGASLFALGGAFIGARRQRSPVVPETTGKSCQTEPVGTTTAAVVEEDVKRPPAVRSRLDLNAYRHVDCNGFALDDSSHDHDPVTKDYDVVTDYLVRNNAITHMTRSACGDLVPEDEVSKVTADIVIGVESYSSVFEVSWRWDKRAQTIQVESRDGGKRVDRDVPGRQHLEIVIESEASLDFIKRWLRRLHDEQKELSKKRVLRDPTLFELVYRNDEWLFQKKGEALFDTSVSWDDIVLPDHEKSALREELAAQLKLPVGERRFGALFTGPPGTGKTLLMRLIMRELNCHVIFLGSRFHEMTTEWYRFVFSRPKMKTTEGEIYAIHPINECVLVCDEADVYSIFQDRKTVDAWQQYQREWKIAEMQEMHEDRQKKDAEQRHDGDEPPATDRALVVYPKKPKIAYPMARGCKMPLQTLLADWDGPFASRLKILMTSNRPPDWFDSALGPRRNRVTFCVAMENCSASNDIARQIVDKQGVRGTEGQRLVDRANETGMSPANLLTMCLAARQIDVPRANKRRKIIKAS